MGLFLIALVPRFGELVKERQGVGAAKALIWRLWTVTILLTIFLK